jgi:hypothetical protein
MADAVHIWLNCTEIFLRANKALVEKLKDYSPLHWGG